MSTLKEQELFDKGVKEVAQKYAPRMAADAKQGFNAAFKRRSGRVLRSHKPRILTDRTTGDTYAFGVTANQVGFILAHGQRKDTKGHKRTSTSGTSFRVGRHRHPLPSKPYIFQSVARFAPQVASDIAKVSAKAIVTTGGRINLK